MNRETVPCKTCGEVTPMLGTKLCNACWETESRLASYLRNGGGNAQRFVSTALANENMRLRLAAAPPNGADTKEGT